MNKSPKTADLTRLPSLSLMSAIESLDEQVKALKEHRGKLMGEAEARFLTQSMHQLEATNGLGTTHIERDGVKVSCTVGKKVVWDNDLLKQMASGMSWEVAQKIFSIKFSITENMFNSLGGLNRTLAEDARTVVPQKPKLTLQDAAE